MVVTATLPRPASCPTDGDNLDRASAEHIISCGWCDMFHGQAQLWLATNDEEGRRLVQMILDRHESFRLDTSFSTGA